MLHAVPDLTVDVYVNGERTINDFKPRTLAGLLSLDAGSYEVAITATPRTTRTRRSGRST